jgi:hypothetical protein
MQIATIRPKDSNQCPKPSDEIEYATKYDIALLRAEIEKLEMRLIIKLGTMMAFWASIILTLIKL